MRKIIVEMCMFEVHCGTHIIDTHDNHVIPQVWELFRRAYGLCGGASALLEWDAQIPEFPVLHAEILKARKFIAGDSSVSDRMSDAVVTAAQTVPHPVNFVVANTE